MAENDVILELEDVAKWFPLFERGIMRKKLVGFIKAVDGVSFQLPKGKTIGLVGESGCGKTTLSRVILRLIEPTRGKVIFDGIDITSLPGKELRKLRKRMQMVFQDPYGSLNPRLSVEEIISEGLKVHFKMNKKERHDRVIELLQEVGLEPYHALRYPHEFSGGQRQRIGIARALAVEPELLVLDEPVSALDVAVQAQILNLLMDIKTKFNLTYIFVAHDLSVVYHISDVIMVMYLGKIVEIAPAEDFLRRPMHPYSEALISAIPIPDPDFQKERIVLPGDVPSPVNPPSGCRFRTRCPYAQEECAVKEPVLEEKKKGHWVACHFPLEKTQVAKWFQDYAKLKGITI